MIINGGEQLPFGSRLRGPEMLGGIVVHQRSYIIGADCPIMSRSVHPLLIVPIFFARRMMVGSDTKI